MNNFSDRLNEIQRKLSKTRKLHGSQIELLKQRLSALSIELQCLQTSISCELAEAGEILDRLERSERHQRSTSFERTQPEPNYTNGRTPEPEIAN